jgi:hypothetical protein
LRQKGQALSEGMLGFDVWRIRAAYAALSWVYGQVDELISSFPAFHFWKKFLLIFSIPEDFLIKNGTSGFAIYLHANSRITPSPARPRCKRSR